MVARRHRLNQRQPEPYALRFMRRVAGGRETIEEPVRNRIRHTPGAIADLARDGVTSIEGGRFHDADHGCPSGAEFDGVVQEVDEGAHQSAAIGENDEFTLNPQVERDSALLGQ